MNITNLVNGRDPTGAGIRASDSARPAVAPYQNLIEVPGYVNLQREVHDALRAQHPEWVQPGGHCPTCDSYESRLVELLTQTLRSQPERDPIAV